MVVGSPKILGRVIRIPHSGGAVHRVCWFLLLVYPASFVPVVPARAYGYSHPACLPCPLCPVPATPSPHIFTLAALPCTFDRRKPPSLPRPCPSCSAPAPSAPSFTASAPHLVLKPPATPAVCCLAPYHARSLRRTGASERNKTPQLEPGCNVVLVLGLGEGLSVYCMPCGGWGLGDESKLDCSRSHVAYSGVK